MNKKIAIGIGIAAVAIVIGMVGLKATVGDKALEVPGEENTENALHVQESNGSSASGAANTTQSEAGSSESSESGP